MKPNARFLRCLNTACLLAFALVGALNRSASANEGATYALRTLKTLRLRSIKTLMMSSCGYTTAKLKRRFGGGNFITMIGL
jgi:hypothetical protein